MYGPQTCLEVLALSVRLSPQGCPVRGDPCFTHVPGADLSRCLVRVNQSSRRPRRRSPAVPTTPGAGHTHHSSRLLFLTMFSADGLRYLDLSP